jgi:hypothetical protein
MTLHQATRDALRKYLNGEMHHPALTPVTKRLLEAFHFAEENQEELEALRAAEEEGDFEKLARLVETKGELRIPDGRAYVAARLRGEKRKQGAKRTIENSLRRIQLYLRVADLVREEKISEAEALRRCMGNHHEFGATTSFDTISSDFKRGKDELRCVLESLGFKTGTAFQKKQKGSVTR